MAGEIGGGFGSWRVGEIGSGRRPDDIGLVKFEGVGVGNDGFIEDAEESDRRGGRGGRRGTALVWIFHG